MKIELANLARLPAVIEPMLRQARIPGAAIAIVVKNETVFARGFGIRDLRSRKPVTAETVYPIASTTKALNATLLGMLVDDGRLEWDAPVQTYLPRFRLGNPGMSSRVTIRDLVTMQTGLPRHDWMRVGSTMDRAELVERMGHLELSADLRRRFQYCNLSVTAAGHVAEVITGKSWERLVSEKIFGPLGMRMTGCLRPARGNVTLSYHENVHRRLLVTRRLTSEVTAPSGGAVHSTVTDMGRWIAFNLSGGKTKGRQLVSAKTLAEIHAPQVVIGDRSLTTMPRDGAYALGWLVDSYHGHKRISHTGYLHDVHSSLMCFPQAGLGLVSFVNFGPLFLAEVISQYVLEALCSLSPVTNFDAKVAQYEARIANTRKRQASVTLVPATHPTHALREYVGTYLHAAYGVMVIQQRQGKLFLRRGELALPLKHWHYDVWVAETGDLWSIHQANPFDASCPLQFLTNTSGRVDNLAIALEATVAPIRFEKQARTVH